MRVLVVTNMYPTAAEPWFGIFVREQVEGLRALGVDVRLLSFDGRRRRSAYLSAARAVRLAAADGVDIVHAHYGLTGLIALAQRRAPVVTTFWGSDLGYIAWQGRVSRLVARLTEPIFASREGAARFGMPKASVVPSSVDLERFRPVDRGEARAALGWTARGPLVLFPSGRANRVKRADVFDEVVEIARRSIPQLGTVSLVGFDRDQTALVMNAVDAMLLTSDSEGSPTVVREALACATPVVSVPVGDVAETLRGLPGCSVTDRNTETLADALVDAINSPRRLELRERASEYGRDRIAQLLLDVYERVLFDRNRFGQRRVRARGA